jgi:hypothetical protein
MTKLNFTSAALIAAAMLAPPVMARELTGLRESAAQSRS